MHMVIQFVLWIIKVSEVAAARSDQLYLYIQCYIFINQVQEKASTKTLYQLLPVLSEAEGTPRITCTKIYYRILNYT